MLTKPQRRIKAKQLAQLIEVLDVRVLVRDRLAHECLDSDQPELIQSAYKCLSYALQVINQAATEGPLPYVRTRDKLGEPAE